MRLAQAVRDAGGRALVVGGCVRDALLGREPSDYDVATDAPPDRISRLFPRTAEVGACFGVVLVRSQGLTVEVATFRADGRYTDARRPDTVTFSNPADDAARRDYTVNALFWSPDRPTGPAFDHAQSTPAPTGGWIIDFVGGLQDLDHRLIRAVGNPDRGNTAASQLKPGDIDWDHIFGKLGVRWFHTGGIFAALSTSTAELTVEAVKAAKKYGTIVSYDLNYRPSLWKTIGGLKKAQEVNREIAQYVDVMIGNEEDFTASLGFAVKGAETLGHIETDAFKAMIETAVKEFPNFKVAATTLRHVITATKNDWSAILWHDGKFFESRPYPGLEILDRVGGGDSFASGVQFGFMEFNDAQKAVEYGAAHGALASTTPGDTSMATRKEVEKAIAGGGARVVR
jgi:sugar/nucleoside kinase (ribokinase family)